MGRHKGKVWVRKLRTRYDSHPWEVRARGLHGYDYYATFERWREAQNFADRLSRTREVVLPAPVPDPPRDVHRPAWHVDESMHRSWVAVLGPGVWVTDRYGWGERLDADLAEKYALTLLAAAKCAKGKQR